MTDLSHARRARLAVSLLFLGHGALVGSWAPHIPLLKQSLGLGPAALGWILLAMAGGAVAAMPLAGVAINRFGSATVARACAAAMAASFVAPPLAGSSAALAAGLFAFGAALGALDVAMNAHGVAVEDRIRRPVMSAFHGWYSVGAAAGAALGGGAVSALGVVGHVALAAALGLALFLAAWPRLLGPVDRGLSGAHFGWPTPATLRLGALCFIALMIEGAALDWAAIRLRERAGASVAVAALGFAAFSAGMAAARFAGDRLRARFGAVALVRGSALALAAGMAVAVAAPAPWLAVPALVAAGLGVGNIAPVLFAGGARAEPDAPGRGVAAVTTMGYSGFLIGPPAIGGLAEVVGLGAALGLAAASALVIAAGAGAARGAG